MSADQLVNFLGFTNEDPALIEAINKNGGSIGSLSPKKMKEIAVDFVAFSDKGVELSFKPKEFYLHDYGVPNGVGPYVMVGVFFYPNGSSKYAAYEGRIPFAAGPVSNREQALAAFGEPEDTDEEDGEIYSDLWTVEGKLVQADYGSDLSVKEIAVCFHKKN